jgi:glycosyltransferase involved in cell wall biosynthesis
MIARVPEGVVRPKWSVMIPAYNCSRFLRQTLESVLSQAPGDSLMQIEVVDDCSTKDDPKHVVDELGQGRVSYHRNAVNLGPINTFNTCVERSRGELIHILHGDDWVLPGFYTRVEQAFAQHDDVALVATRSFVADEAGVITDESPVLPVTITRDTSAMHVTNPLRTPSVVIRRSFYEQHGVFMPEFIHTADWEMWVRAIRLGGGLFVNELLACYREFAQNHTALLAKTGRNFEDRLLLANYWSQSGLPGFDAQGVKESVAMQLHDHARQLKRQGDDENAARCEDLWLKNSSLSQRIREGIKDVGRAILRR